MHAYQLKVQVQSTMMNEESNDLGENIQFQIVTLSEKCGNQFFRKIEGNSKKEAFLETPFRISKSNGTSTCLL